MKSRCSFPSSFMGRVLCALPVWLGALGLGTVFGYAAFSDMSQIAPALVWVFLGMCIVGPLPVLFNTPGRYPSLMICYLGWIAVIALCANVGSKFFPALPVILFCGAIIVLVTIWVLTIGLAFGYQKIYRLEQAGQPIQDWEWVYTGAEFARNHVFSQRRYLIVIKLIYSLFVILPLLASFVTLTEVQDNFVPLMIGCFVLISCLAIIALIALWRHWPVAYPLICFLLVLSFPFSVFFLWYWVESRRVNLVYQHRFERLAPPRPLS